MESTSLRLLICMLFAIGIGSCLGLDCYSCSFTAGCGDPFDPAGKTTTTCPSGQVCQAQMVSSGGNELYSRDCIEPEYCSPGCINAPGQGNVCSYCCDEDLCNSQSIADAVADILHCYLCAYTTDPSAANFSSEACNDPFDPSGQGVVEVPCPGGECGIITTNYSGQRTLSRVCLQNDTFPGGCTPGCDALSITCQTCCSENLCNGGPDSDMSTTRAPIAPSTTPSAAPPTTAGGKTALAAMLIMSGALLVDLP